MCILSASPSECLERFIFALLFMTGFSGLELEFSNLLPQPFKCYDCKLCTVRASLALSFCFFNIIYIDKIKYSASYMKIHSKSLHVWNCTVYMQYLQKPEEGVGSSGIGIAYMWVMGTKPRPIIRAANAHNSRSIFQPQHCLSKFCVFFPDCKTCASFEKV